MSLIEGVNRIDAREDLARIRRSFHYSQSRAKLGSWEFDPVSGGGWWSRQMYVLFGFDVKQPPPTLEHFLQLIHPHDRSLLAENRHLLAKAGQTRTIHYRSNPEIGPQRFFVEIVERVVCDGREILAGTTQDVTEHRAAEQEIHEFELALENAMQGISRLDCQGRFVIVKPQYAMMLGYEPDELVGKSWEVTVPDSDHQIAIDGCLRMMREGRAEVECRAVRKDGSIFFKHLLLVKTCDGQGQHDGHYCFMRDISERKHAMSRLAAHNRQQDAVARLGLAALEETSIDQLMQTAAELVSEILEVDVTKILGIRSGRRRAPLALGYRLA